ncbi:MAG: hypothetical protein SH850_06235, partial [Planctomycetaceae bacterium]|nr:hypothetical protein [Planctomycetaceae bacterium]
MGLEDSAHPTPRRKRQRSRDQDRHRACGLVLREPPAEVRQPLQHLGGGLEVERRRPQTRQKHAGDEARIAIRRNADEEPRPQIVRLLFEPVAMFVDDRPLASEAVPQRPPRAVRFVVELARQGIAVERLRRPVELGEQLVVGVYRPRRVAHRQPGGDAEVRPVSPAVIDAPTMDPSLALELKQRD